MKKRRPDRKIARLTEEQQDALWDALRTPGTTYASVKAMVAAKWRLDISIRALGAFWEERAAAEEQERYIRSANVARTIGDKAGKDLPQITDALKTQLTHAAFQLALSGGDEKRIQTFMDIVGGINKAELTKARIALELEKFKESLKTQQDKALDALFAEVKGNTQAEALFFKFRDAVRGAAEAA